jgi:putative colanic acid biosynthesis UDP-glucose lipid carrier transferase
MRVDSGKVRLTTLENDERIFPFGKFIRRTKIDEMPQVVNILKGEMSVVGPRPEDKENADKVYVGEYVHILEVKPGLTSTASLYDYTHGELFEDEESYEKEFMPKKLKLELYYVKHRSLWYDIVLVLRTAWLIILKTCGKRVFNEPKELGVS